MPFTILPALDVARGRLAVPGAGGPQPVAAFGGDPVAAARALVARGATALHLVDLDLALGGAPGLDVAVIRDVAPGALIQVSAGITTLEAAHPYLAAGAYRFVLTSTALTDEEATTRILRDGASRVVVGLEIHDGRIRPRSIGSDVTGDGLDLMSTVGWLHAEHAPAFLVTATARVGGLEGPDVPTVRRVARAGLPTFAAGGIRSLEDLRALRDAGAAGAVVGRAVLEGSLDVEAGLAWAAT